MKNTPIGGKGRDELKKYNDRRYKSGIKGVQAKEKRAVEKWMETNKLEQDRRLGKILKSLKPLIPTKLNLGRQ